MALEEKEKITIIEAILEAEEEVKITPPARRKKAERLKNKANENLPKPACKDETNDSSVTDINDGSSLTGAKLNETDDIETSKQELPSQVNAINNTESHEAKNGILENSVTAEVSDKERPFGNTVDNSCMESEEELAALVNETNSLRDSEENEKVAATLSTVSDIKEEPREGLESCISLSPDITSGNVSQDDESFFSADEAETTSEFINSSSTLPNLTEVVNETTVESENKEVLSPVISKNTSTNETVADDLEREGQERSRDQISNTRLQTSSEDLKESFENRDIIPEISDEHSLSTDTDLTDNSFTVNDSGTSATVRIDSPDSDLLADTDLGAVGGVLESDSDSDEVWSSSSNTSSEGEYDVGYFESNRGIQEENRDDSNEGLKEILSAFPRGTELVSVTTDSEDDSNRGDTPRNNFKNTEQTDSSLLDREESDTGLKMLACFSPESGCPVVMDDTSIDQETTVVNSLTESSEIEDNATKTPTALASFAGEIKHEDSEASDNNSAAVLDGGDTTDGIPSESPNVDSLPSGEENNVIVKRTGSFRLIKNNGLLKIIDTSETPGTKEDVKKAKLVKNQSLKSDEVDSGGEPASDSTEAKEALQSAVSEAKAFEEELKNVCADIATLDRVSTDDAKSIDSESDANRDDLGEDTVDSGAVVVSVDSIKPVVKLEGVTINETVADETGDSATEGETEESVDGVDSSSSDNKRKQRPKRLPMGKRYSLGTETALLSPEDKMRVELTNFGNTGSFKSHPAPVSTEAQASAAGAAVDGQEKNAIITPSPPPRTKALTYSGSFSPGVTRAVALRPRDGNRPLTKRARSERRSKTLPNNVFDMFGSAFKTSSPSPELVQQGPITMITDNMPATFPGFPVNRRAQVALELYTTEMNYVRGLEIILQLFKRPCEENKLLDKKEIHTMFLNIQDIFFVNKDLLFMLLERINHWHDQQCLGDIFLDQSFKIIDRMKIYAKFCNNYDAADTLYKQKIKKKEFEAFLNTCYKHQVCQPGLNLPAYLITVVQRIPRYLLLLQDLMKRTPENHPDHGNLNKALTKMEDLAVYINNQLQTAVGKILMEQFRLRIEGLKALEGRALIKEGEVTVNGSKKTRQCLLLNDMVVFAAKGATRTSEVEKTLELVTLWCMDLEDNNPQSVKEDSLEIYTPEHSYVIYTGSKNEKKVWLQKLRTAIAQALHGEEANERNEIESRKATFTYKDGRNYCGNFVSGKRHGEGTLSWPNQARYEGNWEDDDRCGSGELMYNSGDKYRGEWLDDKQHGIGTMEYMHGDVYHGQWYEGDMHGKGAIDFKNGDRFDGEFRHNEIQGFGELRCLSGLMYRGDWRHSKKHGKGKMHFPNGDVYSGEFGDDRISGHGEMRYADGSVYKGQWMDNQRGGPGEFSSPDGTHYVGGWSKDHINGKGCMKYSNGDCYDGNWFKNTHFGQGVMKYSNGDVYEGMFEYDLRSKNGKMTYKDGSVYDGSWLNGLRQGKGKMVYANKNCVFEGDWLYGMRHGEGVLTYANRASYRGHWELDKQHGRGMYTDSSTGYHYEGEWKNGLKHGKGVEVTKEGRYEGEWRDNMRHGQGTEILSCETEFEGRWKENRKHGPGIKKLKSGMMEEQHWQEGKQVNVTSIVVTELPLIQRR